MCLYQRTTWWMATRHAVWGALVFCSHVLYSLTHAQTLYHMPNIIQERTYNGKRYFPKRQSSYRYTGKVSACWGEASNLQVHQNVARPTVLSGSTISHNLCGSDSTEAHQFPASYWMKRGCDGVVKLLRIETSSYKNPLNELKVHEKTWEVW